MNQGNTARKSSEIEAVLESFELKNETLTLLNNRLRDAINRLNGEGCSPGTEQSNPAPSNLLHRMAQDLGDLQEQIDRFLLYLDQLDTLI